MIISLISILMINSKEALSIICKTNKSVNRNRLTRNIYNTISISINPSFKLISSSNVIDSSVRSSYNMRKSWDKLNLHKNKMVREYDVSIFFFRCLSIGWFVGKYGKWLVSTTTTITGSTTPLRLPHTYTFLLPYGPTRTTHKRSILFFFLRMIGIPRSYTDVSYTLLLDSIII